MAGIGEIPLSSSVIPETAGAPGPNIPAGSEELNSGEEEKAPMLKSNIFPLKADKVAGFHCIAPLISSGIAVAAPPIDIFTAPTPCIM